MVKHIEDYKRGFDFQGSVSRGNWSEAIAEMGYGAELKEHILKPGQWQIGATGFGKMLSHDDNRTILRKTKKINWNYRNLLLI